MPAEVEKWDDERSRDGQASIGIGIHYVPVVIGDVGSERTTAFAGVGDTVNTASRLQGVTRELGCGIVTSELLTVKARDMASDLSLINAFRPASPRVLRVRSAPVDIWYR
ncbi:adenylate/guanylate cyclase domain-containing protein [Microvirga vignae]|uniref:adenylate/guanylate cyclase domain-containing protein n=1 Tax=Microvirga vignae TaxID=1225564 RepID=UPI001FCDE311